MASRFWIGGTGTWDASTTTNWSATSGGTGGQSVPGAGDTVTFDGSSGGGVVTVNTNFSVTSVTMGAFTGTLDFSANNNSPTMQTWSNTGTATRTVNLGSGTFNITGSGSTILDWGVATNLTIGANTSTFNLSYSGGTGTRIFNFAAATAGRIHNITVSAGSDVMRLFASTYDSIDFTGFSGSIGSGSTQTIFGNLTTSATMTNSSFASTIIFSATSGTQMITSNGFQWGVSPVIINGVGGTVQLADNFFTASSVTLTNGTLNANNFNVTCTIFSSSNSNTRTLTMGSGTWTLTGNNTTVWNTGTTTNMVWTSTTAEVIANYSGGTGTRQFSGMIGPGTVVPNPRLFITAGTDTISFTNSTSGFQSIDFIGFGGTLTAGSTTTLAIRENLILSPTMTNSFTAAINFSGTTLSSTAGTFTTNGITMASVITFGNSATAINWSLGSDLVNTSTIGLTIGTFNANNFNVTASSFSSSNSNTRTLTMGSGTWTLTGTGTVWNTATATNLTLTPNTSIILLSDTSSSSKTFSGGGETFNNLELQGNGTGAYIIAGSNTFNRLFLASSPSLVQFTASTTTTITNPIAQDWSGSIGAVNTFQSTSGGTAWTISSPASLNEDYISLQDSIAAGAVPFYAGAHSTNVSGNVNWVFQSPTGPGGDTAAIDGNGVGTLLGVSQQDGVTTIRVVADPATHSLGINDGTTGSDNGNNNGSAMKDQNGRSALIAVSSVDGVTPVEVYVDQTTGNLLIDSS